MSIEATAGDATVPIISSRRRNNGIDLNYTQNQASDYRFFVVAPSDSKDDALAEHNGMHKNPAVQRLITDLLFYPNYGISYTDAPGAGSAGVKADFGTSAGLQSMTDGVDSYYLNIYGLRPETLSKSLPIVATFSESINEAYFSAELLGDNAAQVIIDPTENYQINFDSIGEPMRIEILKGKTNIIPMLAIRYLDINLPSGTKLLLNVSPAGIENLKYDADGDGFFESEIAPTSAVSGKNALDKTAPTLSFNFHPLTQTVSIASYDAESGTRKIYYSLNGTSFAEYTQPVSVNPTLNQKIYGFAEDNAGNRSQIFNQTLLMPTAAATSISGRILGTTKATVKLIRANGNTTTTRTSAFGYYHFNNLPVGETYIVQPFAKGVNFSPNNLIINLTDVLENASFVAAK